ncbi:peptidase family M20/M25/M40, putative N-carbamoyl-L-amino acid amidohydrolase [Campylobacter pinnipediorum subsp. caledonicus]|uniref:Peptidase family M20/M25/M40, putative N-carbamoyl-L-amino acid amidohydrolase n=1 Tax=Campylobacter pinnipediorum subsp. caledonicus TaxID=1874362 RepID=A0A1S6U7H8_9BACT|nr:M20 family metallo-hydrolase [Campylobacter pinnipediorum]AQW87696.1 peptidase family M20/M25/M40, putative N-carbamoyl-L-amino acid amidohydrolase [Campylobacter pinnipediorum subsp. caledonicus]
MINTKRLKEEFQEISRFGALKDKGITRLAFSNEDKDAREYLIKLIKQSGLKIKIDNVGNMYARFDDVKEPNLSAISVGSHIDSVPNGGFYDGTLGVMSGLEAIRSIKESGLELKRPLELIVFVCEESSRFKMATIGSKIISSKLDIAKLKDLKDDNGISVFDAMKNFNLNPENLQECILKNGTYLAYLELHIEQGPVLERHNIPVGLVSGIAAPIRYELKVKGKADHSGATPMNMRKDALVCSSEIILNIEKLAKTHKTSVATVGYVKTSPGVLNVIPQECVLGIDIRDIDSLQLQKLDSEIYNCIVEICKNRACDFELLQLTKDTPVVLDEKIIKLMKEQAEKLKIKTLVLPSGAGHDAMHMKGIAYFVGMIFIPCKDGISHNVNEDINFDDAFKGAELLAKTMFSLANL